MKGLSFSQEMMIAWLTGRKSITRRMMNPQPEWEEDPGECHDGIWRGRYRQLCHDGSDYSVEVWEAKPKFTPGETVYIKETWMGTPDCLSYKASDPRQVIEFGYDRWRSPRFMPEWASRSHAVIKSVCPERVREITIEELSREGINLEEGIAADGFNRAEHFMIGGCPMKHYPEIYGFAALWESLHPGTWEQNPWVWRIELEKVEVKANG